MKTIYHYLIALITLFSINACTKTETDIEKDPCYEIILRNTHQSLTYMQNRDIGFSIWVSENKTHYLTDRYTLTLETEQDSDLLSLIDNQKNPVEYLESWTDPLNVIYTFEHDKPFGVKFIIFYVNFNELDTPATYQKIRFKFTYESGEIHYSRPYILYIEKNPDAEIGEYKYIMKPDLW